MEYYIEAESGVNIFVRDIHPQSEKVIFFIHGWPGSNELFEYQYNVLGQMGYRLIGVDTRGFGKSSKPWEGYNYDRLADDIHAVISALRLRDITLLGHSTGGAIAIRYMSRYNGFGVSKLVLCSSAAPSLVERPNFPYGQNPDVVNGLIEEAETDRPQMLQDFGKMFFYSKVTPAFLDWFFYLGVQAASWATIAIEEMWLREVLFRDLQTIHVPTLILHGIHDQVVPYPLGVVQNQSIRGSRLVPFENSGHGVFYDERERFNRELVEFTR